VHNLVCKIEMHESTCIHFLFIAKRNKFDILCITIKQHPLLFAMKRCGWCLKNVVHSKITYM